MAEDGGLDPQRSRAQPASNRRRPPGRFAFQNWRTAEVLIPMPFGTIGVQSRAGVLVRFAIRLAFSGGLEPPTSRFGDGCSSC
jgi:hypothetical protein